MVEPTDSTLIRRTQEGDTAAFGLLMQRYQTAVYNTAYRIMGRRQDAEDGTQEAFLRAYRALDRFDVKRPFAPWIKRIAVNVCLNWLDKAQNKTQMTATELQRPGDDDAPDMDRWSHRAASPEQVLEVQDQNARLRAGILSLPPKFRVVIELRHFQELNYEEMAELLKRPLSSVKSDLFRARKQLAQILKGNV